VRRPHAIGVAPSGRPRQHRRVVPDPQRGAECHQQPCRVGQHVGRVDDRPAVRPQDLDLLAVPEIGQGRLAADLRVGRDDVRRVADQEGVPQLPEPAPSDVRQQVVRHVLLVVHPYARRQRPGDGGRDVLPAVRLGRQHVVPARVVESGLRQVVGVQRLVDDERVAAGTEAAHHRGRDVPRPRPHHHPDRHARSFA
jgi:hypothetical protein